MSAARNRPRPAAPSPGESLTPGAWGTVLTAPDARDEVTLHELEGWPDEFYGPVGFVAAGPEPRMPVKGDRAFLSFDHLGAEALAMVWGSGDQIGGGEQGPQGPQGETGPQGPQGPEGSVTITPGDGIAVDGDEVSVRIGDGLDFDSGVIVRDDVPAVAVVSGVSSYTFSGLDGDTDDIYELLLHGTVSGGAAVVLRLNGDATAANYVGPFTYRSTTVIAPTAQGGQPGVHFTNGEMASGRIAASLKVFARSGGRRTVIFTGTGPSYVYEGQGIWTNTASNVTSLVVHFGGATFTGTLILRKLLQ